MKPILLRPTPKLPPNHLPQRPPPPLPRGPRLRPSHTRLPGQNPRTHAPALAPLALQPLPQTIKRPLIPCPFLTHHPPRHPPTTRAREQVAPVRGADGPADCCSEQAAGELGEGELGRGEVGGRFGCDGDAAGPDAGCLRCGGGGGGGRDAVLVGVRDGGVVVGQQGEEQRRRPAGEVVCISEGERAQDEGEEHRGQEEGVRQRRQYKRLHRHTDILAAFPNPLPCIWGSVLSNVPGTSSSPKPAPQP